MIYIYDFKVCLWKLQKLAFIAALDLVTQETLKGMIILLSYTVYNLCWTIGHSEKNCGNLNKLCLKYFVF